MYNWSVDEKKFKKEDSEGYKFWAKNKKKVVKLVNFLSKNKWIIGGKIYVRKRQPKFFKESPIVIGTTFKKNIPKYEYVSLGFELDEKISSQIDIIDQNKTPNYFSGLSLVGKFQLIKNEGD